MYNYTTSIQCICSNNKKNYVILCYVYRVKTGFQVVDPTVEAAKAQLEAMRKGRYLGGSAKNNSQQNDSPRSFTSKSRFPNLFHSHLSLYANTVWLNDKHLLKLSVLIINR